jgi:hypothetical protein
MTKGIWRGGEFVTGGEKKEKWRIFPNSQYPSQKTE